MFKTCRLINPYVEYVFFKGGILWFQNSTDDVKRHKWFKNILWDDVFAKKLKVFTDMNQSV